MPTYLVAVRIPEHKGPQPVAKQQSAVPLRKNSLGSVEPLTLFFPWQDDLFWDLVKHPLIEG